MKDTGAAQYRVINNAARSQRGVPKHLTLKLIVLELRPCSRGTRSPGPRAFLQLISGGIYFANENRL